VSYTTCPLVLTIDTRANRETLPPTPAPTISQSMASRRVRPPRCPLSPPSPPSLPSLPSPFTLTFTSTFSFRFPPLPLPVGFDSVKPPWALSRSQLDVEPCTSTRASSFSSEARSLFRFFFRRFETASRGSLPIFATDQVPCATKSVKKIGFF